MPRDREDIQKVMAIAFNEGTDSDGDDGGGEAPKLRFLAGAQIDPSSLTRASARRMSSFDASARAHMSVNAHIADAKARGAYYEISFDAAVFGFTVALARRKCVPGSPRSPASRSWCTLTVEDMDPLLAASRPDLKPRDELVAVNGAAVAIRDGNNFLKDTFNSIVSE